MVSWLCCFWVCGKAGHHAHHMAAGEWGRVSTRQGESVAFKGMLIVQPLPTILYSLKLLPPSAIITRRNQAFSM